MVPLVCPFEMSWYGHLTDTQSVNTQNGEKYTKKGVHVACLLLIIGLYKLYHCLPPLRVFVSMNGIISNVFYNLPIKEIK